MKKQSLLIGLLIFGLGGCAAKTADTSSTTVNTNKTTTVKVSTTPTTIVSPVAVVTKTATATPSPMASTGSSSPAPTGKAKPVQAGFERFEYAGSGVEFDCPGDFSKDKEIGDWFGSASPDKKIHLFYTSKEWKDWDDLVPACSDIIKDFKVGDDPIQKTKTADGSIEVQYDFGTGTVKGKPVFAIIAGFLLDSHDFVMVVTLDDPKDKEAINTAVRIILSVGRMEGAKDEPAAEDKKEE